MARRLGWVLAGLVGVAAMAPGVADACGGCFAPPETQQVVTDHRMVMAIHADESILWDQFRYTGRPQDFSWILPVRGEVRVELASGGEVVGRATGLTPSGRLVVQTASGPEEITAGDVNHLRSA